MTEPTVQVPVSLIERIRAGLPLWKYEVDPEADALMAALDAVLSQPTPTPELIACPHWEPGEITMRKGCTACAATPAPPRPEDMAPGTTFTAQMYGGNTYQWVTTSDTRLWMVGKSDWCVVNDLDPSTIRDVTPPAVSP